MARPVPATPGVAHVHKYSKRENSRIICTVVDAGFKALHTGLTCAMRVRII